MTRQSRLIRNDLLMRLRIGLRPIWALAIIDRRIHDCDMAIQLNPRNSVAYYNRGNAHAFLGDQKTGDHRL